MSSIDPTHGALARRRFGPRQVARTFRSGGRPSAGRTAARPADRVVSETHTPRFMSAFEAHSSSGVALNPARMVEGQSTATLPRVEGRPAPRTCQPADLRNWYAARG